ncbi:hypothetical protein M7I_6941 [Glarea lozoyensis 74030]|uniref:Uncharacterized protein n=1 Tax=Glarea lozoyensis (strain ATCC 74030 / MF5533) TaxID=1104152 RepID=H0EVY4_GLAL7|nr:hypothetical protein M7I_6941 [Glarea lozoyensis 74030]
MSGHKGAYETNATDTDFRKKYDRAEYAQKAAEREAKEKEEGKARYEAKLAGKKYYKPLEGNESLTTARASRLDVSQNHLRNIGQTGEVKRAGVDDVRARIEALWEAMEEEKRQDKKTLGERLEVRAVEEEKQREERRRKRRELVERKKAGKIKVEEDVKAYGDDVRVEGEHDVDDMAALMGFGGFGGSKK